MISDSQIERHIEDWKMRFPKVGGKYNFELYRKLLQCGFNVESLNDKCDLGRDTVQKAINGTKSQALTLRRFCKELDCEPEEIGFDPPGEKERTYTERRLVLMYRSLSEDDRRMMLGIARRLIKCQ